MDQSDLHGYQNTSVNHIIQNNHCALFLEMGLGKTVSTLTAINELMYFDADILSVLVVAPKRVVESVWEQETQKWDHLNHLKIVKIIGNPKKRKLALNEHADVHIISRDNIAWLCNQFGGNMLPFDMLVLDELSSFKNSKSIRFKMLRKVRPSFKRIVGLTGTPAPNGLIDLWSQLFLLDGGERLGRFITTFRERFFNRSYNGFSYDLKKETESNIHELISDICISMKADDYLDLPGRIDNIIRLDFDNETRTKYDDFAKEQVLRLFGDDQDITAVNAAALQNKLLQFANGAVYDEDRKYHIIHDLKIDVLKELVEDANGKPVLVAYTYKHDLVRIMEALKKYNPVKLKTDKDIRDWNLGNIQVLVMHPASGGHGLNLQSGGNIIIWFGQTWSLELYQQLNARLDRQGQKEVVIINKLVISGTMDENVIQAQDTKSETQNGLMDATKALIKKYK